jgi:hypothetical protein
MHLTCYDGGGVRSGGSTRGGGNVGKAKVRSLAAPTTTTTHTQTREYIYYT